MGYAMNALSLPLDVLARVLLGLYFLVPGLMKIAGYAGMLAYMSKHGVPWTEPLLILTIVPTMLTPAGPISTKLPPTFSETCEEPSMMTLPPLM